MKTIIKRVDSLANQAYEYLKDSIVSAKILPGEILAEEKLAAELGISRTPLREAMKRLANEGLISIQNGKPTKVATFTKEDSLEFMEIRHLFEVYSLEKLAPYIDEAFIDELKENVEEQKLAVQSGDYRSFIELDREFHLILASKNKNQKLKDLFYETNTGVFRAFLILSNTLEMSSEPAYREHLEIVSALENRDIQLAKDKLTDHLRNIEKRFMNYYK